MKTRIIKLSLTICLLGLISSAAVAQNFGEPLGLFFVKSEQTGLYLSYENGRLVESSQLTADSIWEIQFATLEDQVRYVRFRPSNAEQQYLHVEQGPAEIGATEPGWWSAMWVLESTGAGTVNANSNRGPNNVSQSASDNGQTVIIRNRWRPVVLNANANTVQTVSPTQSAQTTAWRIEPLGQDARAASNLANQIAFGRQKDTISIINNTDTVSINQPLQAEPPQTELLPTGTATAAQENSALLTLAEAPVVVFYVQNYSDDSLGLYIDIDGEVEQVLTLPPRYEVAQESPVGALWRLANESNWVAEYRVNNNSDQQWQYPEKN